MDSRTVAFLTAAGILAACGTAAFADPVNVSFSRITSNAGTTNPASQLNALVSDAGGGMVGFRFTNNVGIASSITDIYFDDNNEQLTYASRTQSGGVSFSQFANPGNLPSGNNVNFATTMSLSFDSDAPASHNGVNTASEWLQLVFAIGGGRTFADVVNDLQSGELRIGLHVQAIGTGGQSDSFVNLPPATVIVPLPTTAALGMAGLGGIAARRRRTGR